MMAVRKQKNGLGAMLAVSTAGHLVLYFALSTVYFPHEIKVTEQVCYVDMVNLPVASPQKGIPAVQAPTAPQQQPAPPTPPTPKTAAPQSAAKMTVPAGPSAKGAKPRQTPDEGTAEDFQQRIARLQEAQQHAQAIEKLQKKTPSATRMPQGMPTGTGTQAGSDYPSYIQSRLKDSFDPQVSSGKVPTAQVELKIDRYGTTWRFVRPSGDKLFDDSVERAIKAGQKQFPPPPGGGVFVQTFLFRPEGVGKK